ncbi:MAG: SDR family NAD(P)-dependent oxidoreductase [Gammaproteobacteria bacterium]
MNVLITGHSRGIGAALTRAHLERGDRVYALARGRLGLEHAGLTQAAVDLADNDRIAAALEALVPAATDLELVWLNAGVLGPIGALSDLPLAALREVFDVNVWANKTILDWLVARRPAPSQVVLMSSGAAVRGNFGWGPYALSKATLNMLAQLYAHELPETHLTALAPGLVDTAMQDALRGHSAARYPSLGRLHKARGTADMPDPATAAARLLAALPALREQPSGAFVDLRSARLAG